MIKEQEGKIYNKFYLNKSLKIISFLTKNNSRLSTIIIKK